METLRTNKKYCSDACKTKGQRITKNCLYCGKQFQANPFKFEGEGSRYCSFKCRNKAQYKNGKMFQLSGDRVSLSKTRECGICQKLFHFKPAQKYCSTQCSELAKELHDRKYLLQKYNLTEEKYKQMEERQGWCCAICHSTNKGSSKSPRLWVDHDHKTGKVRGLLCFRCNAAIGLFRDSVETTKEAARYLEDHASAFSDLASC